MSGTNTEFRISPRRKPVFIRPGCPILDELIQTIQEETSLDSHQSRVDSHIGGAKHWLKTTISGLHIPNLDRLGFLHYVLSEFASQSAPSSPNRSCQYRRNPCCYLRILSAETGSIVITLL